MAITERNTTIVSAYVEPDLRLELIRRAEENERSVSAEIRRALTEYVERNEKETQ